MNVNASFLDGKIRRHLVKTYKLYGSDLDDMAQECWVGLLEKNAVEIARHWGYIQSAIRSVVIDKYRFHAAQKRGSQFVHVPIEWVSAL